MQQNDIYLSRFNPNNEEEVMFLYKTRKDPKVDMMLTGDPPKNLLSHVEYLYKKCRKIIFILYLKESSLKIPIGYCSADINDQNACELGWVIAPNFQGKGFGKLAVKYLSEIARTWLGEQAHIYLKVLKINKKAIGLYEKMGYELITKYETDVIRMKYTK